LELTVQVLCTDLPGSTFDQGRRVYKNVHLGIQQNEEILGATCGDAKKVVLKPVFRVAPAASGGTKFPGSLRERHAYRPVLLPGMGGEVWRQSDHVSPCESAAESLEVARY
jgi:hypothetical protein